MAIDTPPPFGLGWIESPPDEADYPIANLYALRGIEEPLSLPLTYVVPPPMPPVYNQGSAPQCVPYSSAFMKAYEDLRDQGSFNWDENRFFTEIGGTASGAQLRNAFARMLNYGYPVIPGPSEAQHKIKAYYAVPLDSYSIMSAVASFGPVLLGTPWYHSWWYPTSAGVLPKPDYQVGGHAIAAIGWDARGLRLRNSWGSAWGIGGECWLPWAYFGNVREAWKAVDVIESKFPPGTAYFPGGKIYRYPSGKTSGYLMVGYNNASPGNNVFASVNLVGAQYPNPWYRFVGGTYSGYYVPRGVLLPPR